MRGLRPGVRRGPRGCAACSPSRRGSPARPYLRDAGRGPGLPPAAPGGCSAGAGRTTTLTLGEFLARRRLLPATSSGHFMIPLVSAVWSCRPADALGYPAPLPVPVPRPPRDALGRRLARGGGRSPAAPATYVEPDRPRACPASRPACRCGPCGAAPTASSSSRRRRHPRDDAVRHRHPPRPGAAAARRPTDDEREVLGAFRYSRNEIAAAHRHQPAAAPPRRARASWNYLLRDCAGAAERRPRQLLHEPPAAARRADRLPGHAQRRRTGSARRRCSPDDLRPPASTRPRSVAAQRRLPDLNSAAHRLRRRLPRLGLPRGRLPVRRPAAAALGVRW